MSARGSEFEHAGLLHLSTHDYARKDITRDTHQFFIQSQRRRDDTAASLASPAGLKRLGSRFDNPAFAALNLLRASMRRRRLMGTQQDKEQFRRAHASI